MHIKEIHGSQPCRKFANNECRRSRCWFEHTLDFQLAPTRVLHSPVGKAQRTVHQVWGGAQHQMIQQVTQQVLTQVMPSLVQQIMQSLNHQSAN